MTANVVPLPGLAERPTAAQLATRVRMLMRKPSGMQFGHPHFQLRLVERRLNMRQILETLKKGVPIGEPVIDEWGDWRVKLRRKVAGRRVQVVVAVKEDHFVAVTAI